MHVKSVKSCLTVYYPMGCGPQGSSVHGIIQARILEWVAMPSSKLKVLHSKFTFLVCIKNAIQLFQVSTNY